MIEHSQLQQDLGKAKAALLEITCRGRASHPLSMPLTRIKTVVSDHPLLCLGGATIVGVTLARYSWTRRVLWGGACLAARVAVTKVIANRF